MLKTVISVEKLYKEYKLGVISHGTLYHDMQSWWARIRGKEDPNSIISVHHSSDVEEGSFLALNDVSFEVKEGEILGIIGKNGAGKSTLLKILSRITSPTKGQIKIKGRVGSLLEVGTGFHPELTGRENIYLNGAILGMRKWEIDKKLDEIIDFAGIERHIDTPVKRYSSGMYVRLAFSVAAHLDPEILAVDEVLAVGDADFQKKCLGKMKDISEGQGRTVLFVSHNMKSILNLCTRTILLKDGSIEKEGITEEIINYYQSSSNNVKTLRVVFNDKYVNNIVKLIEVRIFQDNFETNISEIDLLKETFIYIKYYIFTNDEPILIGLALKNNDGNVILSSGDIPGILLNKKTNYNEKREKGIYESKCTIPSNFFNDCTYYINIAVNRDIRNTYFFVEDCLSFDVVDNGELRYHYNGRWDGVIRPLFNWETKKIEE